MEAASQEEIVSFEVALERMKAGVCMTRGGWNGKGMYVTVQQPDENSKMQQPYLYIVPGDEMTVPWQPSQWDMFSNDWYEWTPEPKAQEAEEE